MFINIMSNSNNNNIYSDSENEDTNSVEYIYTEASTNNNDTPTNNKPNTGDTPTIRPGFTFGGGAFGGTPAPGPAAFGAFGGKPASVPTTLHFGGVCGTPLPAPASFGAFSGTPSSSSSFGGFGLRVTRQPETGQPMGCNLRPPPGMCGGNNNPSDIFNVKSAKQNTIDDLYKKLANARAQIQNLNKTIDDIYEIIPKIN
jgi:hypothetical protein